MSFIYFSLTRRIMKVVPLIQVDSSVSRRRRHLLFSWFYLNVYETLFCTVKEVFFKDVQKIFFTDVQISRSTVQRWSLFSSCLYIKADSWIFVRIPPNIYPRRNLCVLMGFEFAFAHTYYYVHTIVNTVQPSGMHVFCTKLFRVCETGNVLRTTYVYLLYMN